MDDHRIAILICCVLVISYNIYNSFLLLLDIILHTDLIFKKISEKKYSARPKTYALYSSSHIQAAPPNKLPQNRVLRYILAAHPDKIVQKFEKPFGLQILFRIPGNPKEKRLGVLL